MISQSIAPLVGFGGGGAIWEGLHEAAAGLTMGMVGAHLLLHGKWIWKNSQKYLFSNQLPTLRWPGKQPVTLAKHQ